MQKLQAAGHRITHARLVILTVLSESSGHLTSAEIIERVEAQDPSIGRASIFRTLDLLTSLAIVRPTFLTPITPSYILMAPTGHHSHIICTHCNRVIEVDDCYVDGLTDVLQGRYDVRLIGHLVEFYGLCEACSSVPPGRDGSR